MIWEKENPMPTVKQPRYSDVFEYMFVFSKGKPKTFNPIMIPCKCAGQEYHSTTKNMGGENGRTYKEFNINKEKVKGNIWKCAVAQNKTPHPAVFPQNLIEEHIKSWSNEGDLVLDPFMGSGTTAKMALLNKRNYIGFELNKDYYEKSLERVAKYIGQVNDELTGVTIMNQYEEGKTEELDLQCDIDNDKELEGKTELFNNLIDEMNKYFNEQSLSILKNLKLTFVNKANDERVKKVLAGETGLEEKVDNEVKLTVPEQPKEQNNPGFKITLKL
jgi:DNA modification methylase